MSANNMSDEELDNLFRKSVERFDPPFDPEAWKAMEQKLDQAKAPAPWYRRFLPLLLLLLLLGPLLLTQLDDETNKPARKENAAVAPATPQATATAPLAQPANKGGNKEMAGAGEGKLNTALEGSVERPVPAYSPPTAVPAAAVKPEAYIANPVPLPVRSQEPQPTQAAPVTEAIVADSALSEEMATGIEKELESDEQHITEQPFKEVPDSTVQVKGPAVAVADSSNVKKRSPFFRSIRLAVLAAPDITTVKFKDPDAVSANAGVVVGVPLTERLSIVTGVVWANKVYGASPEDYDPGPYYWQGKKIPDAIDARCRVLDIPLNLEYRLLQRNKSALAIQAGFSSYIMLDEKYTYIYGSGYNAYEKTWEVQNQNRHWFKVQNISLSYIHHLSPSLFVGAEPFVKIPLSGLGAGNVKLTSAGIFFSAGYNLPLRK